MTWAILCGNIKGGTGKSTVTQQLSYALRDEGYDVGVLDADIDSSNLASRFGATERVEFEGDHIIKPVKHDGLKIFSMENAFEESSFNQTGKFMGDVVNSMVTSSEFGDPDYLVVDCPPGSSDVFEELVRSLRTNILGAVSVGISDAVDDTARFVKICNHNWVPILGFVENMSGSHAYGDTVTVTDHDGEEQAFAPFGSGNIKELAERIGGNFMGEIPLCGQGSDVDVAAEDTIKNMVDTVEDGSAPELPEDNTGDRQFIRNLWGSISNGLEKMNEDLPVGQIQERFGVEGRKPLILELELTDASAITKIFSKVIITIDDGNIKVVRPRKAKRMGLDVEAGVKIKSQDLYDAIREEKMVMRSVTGEVTTEPYSLIDAVKMGDAEVWGDKVINRLSVLDRILSDVVSMSEVQEAMGAT